MTGETSSPSVSVKITVSKEDNELAMGHCCDVALRYDVDIHVPAEWDDRLTLRRSIEKFRGSLDFEGGLH